MTLFRAAHSGIALDVGPASVAACQLVRDPDGPRLHRWALLDDPLREPPAADDNDEQVRARTLRLVQQAGFRAREAAVALQPPDVTFHAATVPPTMEGLPREQWLTMLRFEAARQLQCQPDELEADCWPLPPGNRSGANVMIAAVERERLARWRKLVEGAGLLLRQIDVLPGSLLRFAGLHGAPNDGCKDAHSAELWGVLDVGFSGSRLVVALGGCCVYARALVPGGDSLTQALAAALEVDYATAERLKRRRAPAPPQVRSGEEQRSAKTPAAVEPDDLDRLAAASFQHWTRTLAGDIERAFAYALESYPEATPAALFLCGGGARLTGLAVALQTLLGVPVDLLPPLQEGSCAAGTSPHEGDWPALAACFGLALGDLT